jgi:hypothetical protein
VSETRFADGRLLVVAFEGWNDAGEAASAAVRTLRDQFELQPMAEVDPEDYFDYQFSRPSVVVDDEGERRIVWPGVSLYGPSAPDSGASGSNLYLLLGTEPSRGWKTFVREILDLIEGNEISGVVFLGALLADVPHSRPIAVFTSSENPDVRREFGFERSTYEGPVGILSVLGEAVEAAGIPTVSVWASVPHYVHNAPSPKATLALVDKLEEVVDIVIPRGDLVTESAAWESGIDAIAGDDDDMASYIEQLEQARDTVDSPEASGEAIAQEFERYLRRNGDKPDGNAGDEPWRKE